MLILITINDDATEMTIDPRETLADVLRERARLTGTHIGCRTASCGACTVDLDGLTVKSCCVLAAEANGRSVRTLDVEQTQPNLDDVQTAFVECQAMQCGYCTPGMIMSARHLLRVNPQPNDAEIRRGIAGNLCRCTGYVNIVKAIERVRDTRLSAAGSE